MNIPAKAALAAAIGIFLCGAAAAQNLVATRAGLVRGATANRITSFKGIPYAAPPVGPLRWKAPQPVPPWRDIRDATKAAPACMQSRKDFDPHLTTSEDCLYLNVWRPAESQPSSRLPVMVWIHGGGFVGGSGAFKAFDATSLARNGVIVVTINYRLGRFGWFAHPELSAEGANTGTANFGLMDDIAALQWVHDNIDAFGGDPTHVTVFGESAGGMSVNALMSTPAAQGLFSAAITQSGFGRMPALPLAAAEARGAAFAASAGASDLAALRKLPAEAVLGSADATNPSDAPGLILDGKLMPANVDQTFAKGAEAKVPWLVGSTDYEASLFPDRLANPDATLAALPEKTRKRLLAAYDPQRTKPMGAVVAAIVTDQLFTEPARFLAARHAKSRQPVYRYFFGYVAERARNRVPGAAHGDELKFVFGNLRTDQRSKIEYTDADKGIAAVVGRYWTNFAKTGDPNGAGLAAWPKDGNDRILVIDLNAAHAVGGFRKRQLDSIARGLATP
ncbi:MAG: carboxylesterase family protein [Beijerinckiaceae bacterium]